MIGDSDRDEAGPPDDDFATFWAREARRLMHRLRCSTAGTGLTQADIEDIYQETCYQVYRVFSRTGVRIRKPGAYIHRVATNCINRHLKRMVRQPRRIDGDEMIVDTKSPTPEEEAAERETAAQQERRRDELMKSTERLIAVLKSEEVELFEWQRNLRSWAATHGVEDQSPDRGRPTKAEQAHNLIKEWAARIGEVVTFLEKLKQVL
jgi:DNA-directed RNA polymerase specialized sigma24 family protein